MAFTDHLSLALLDHLFGSDDYTPPASLYVALFTTAPTDTSPGVEVSGTDYARVALTNNNTNFPAGTINGDGTPEKRLAVDAEFPEAGGSWGTVVAWGIFDAATSGNLLAFGALSATQAVESGDTPRIGANDLRITLD